MVCRHSADSIESPPNREIYRPGVEILSGSSAVRKLSAGKGFSDLDRLYPAASSLDKRHLELRDEVGTAGVVGDSENVRWKPEPRLILRVALQPPGLPRKDLWPMFWHQGIFNLPMNGRIGVRGRADWKTLFGYDGLLATRSFRFLVARALRSRRRRRTKFWITSGVSSSLCV